MKVLHVFKDHFPPTRGGIELHIHDVVHSVPGVEFEVLTAARSRTRREETIDGVRIIRAAEYARPTSTPITPSWVREFRTTDADVIHFHAPHPFGELAFLASQSSVPMVATYHGDIVGRRLVLPLYLPFHQRMLSKAKRIVVSSPPMCERERLAPHRNRVVVVPFGIDTGKWVRPTEADEIRERFRPPIVLFVGRLAHFKGVDVLIEAMRGVDGTLLVVGDGPMKQHLASRVTPPDRVQLVGEVEGTSLAALYHAADVFVLPSTQPAESFGIAMLEAMACGCPAVSTELGTGTSWLNVHGETGLVVTPGDPSALAHAISAIASDAGRARAMGDAARDRVEKSFTKAAMLEALADIYASVV